MNQAFSTIYKRLAVTVLVTVACTFLSWTQPAFANDRSSAITATPGQETAKRAHRTEAQSPDTSNWGRDVAILPAPRVPDFSTVLPRQPSDLGLVFPAGRFISESHTDDPGTIQVLDGDRIGFIQDGSWVGFAPFDFGPDGATSLTIVGSSPNAGGTVKVYADAPGTGGELIGFINITNTTGWDIYESFSTASINSRVTGKHPLYFVFTGGFNVESFSFESVPTLVGYTVSAGSFSEESHQGDDSQIQVVDTTLQNIQNGNWVSFQDFYLGAGPLSVTVDAASDGLEGFIDFFLDDPETGIKISTVHIDNTGSLDDFESFSGGVSGEAKGTRDLYLVFSGGYAVKSITFNKDGAGLHVYPPVSGLAESPKYSFRVRKASSGRWQSPFAWYTDIPKFDPDNENEGDYYTSFIGGWSHTYTNFEMGQNTDIEVEISARPDSGIDIISAIVYPADKASVTVSDGKAYVTMADPALVTVDINGELSNSVAPRATETGWNPAAFPYRTYVDGPDVAIHAVTIFANPYIDKPNPNDPRVYTVEPGTPPPADGDWDTLYFKPGIHHLGTGQDNEWLLGDQYVTDSYKSYYIPGDAIVYGNLTDNDNSAISRFTRIYGHGTISGNKMAHPDKYPYQVIDDSTKNKFRMLDIRNARNSTYEGVTVVDQPHHGVYLNGRDLNATENYIKWVKIIGWRRNNDGVSAEGNGYIQDSFIRTQDDATYVRGIRIQRCVYWADVNGIAFRTSFITSDRGEDYPEIMPQELIVEDIDVIFARGVFGGADKDSFGIIGSPAGLPNAPLPEYSQYRVNGETENTGQHVIFRNITFSDPNPHRYLIGFSGLDSKSPAPEDDEYKMGDWAGVRFKNITVTSTPNFDFNNRLVGSQFGMIRDFVFDNVAVDGVTIDQNYVDNEFVTNEFLGDLVFP